MPLPNMKLHPAPPNPLPHPTPGTSVHMTPLPLCHQAVAWASFEALGLPQCQNRSHWSHASAALPSAGASPWLGAKQEDPDGDDERGRGRRKKGREEREAPGRKTSHTCKSGQYTRGPQKGILPAFAAQLGMQPRPSRNTCSEAWSIQTRLEDRAVCSGEMTGGQADRRGSPLFILGVLAMARSMRRSICPSPLHA